MPGIASAATSVVIGHVAAGTSTIRVGAGGIMLPNHSPLVIAEQFGTLESLFPGRIDLGLGRAPGSDPMTARALRRNLASDPDQFPEDVRELAGYFGPAGAGPEPRIRAVPGSGLKVPLWILGSSLFGAQVAAALGLPFAFASHFAPAMMLQALEIYRARFQAVRAARPSVRDAGLQSSSPRPPTRSALPIHLHAASLRQLAERPADAAAAARRRLRESAAAAGARDARGRADVLGGGISRHGAAMQCARSSSARGRTSS